MNAPGLAREPDKVIVQLPVGSIVPITLPKPVEEEKEVVTQMDIDMIDARYALREEQSKKYLESANPALDSYRKQLRNTEKPFDKETIVYDTHTQSWRLIKESDLLK